ncbi:MAG: T9SS type A sorting domain-containing protein [Bacteroidota bacterium]|nr:T9SS type A sorting domain-containing protein [Bacteroidota bacterium]
MKKQCLFFLFCVFFAASAHAQRFTESVFPEIEINNNIVYGNADSWDPLFNGVNLPEDLSFDLYQPPQSDTMAKRPLVLTFFGGAFLKGSSERPDMIAWCDSLAHYGYIAAAMNYRLGFNPTLSGETSGPNTGMKRAAWRAIQDARAAVRYFKHHHETYGIDTTQIYLLGNSAGSITALHAAFMNADEWIPEAGEIGNGANNVDLGLLDESTSLEPSHFNHTTEVSAVISLWGATMDVDYIEVTETIPTMLVHGTADNIVPYDEGPAFNFGTGFDMTFTLYGSLPIHEHMESLGMTHEFYSYPNQPHAFYSCGEMSLTELERDSFPCEYWPPIFYDGIDFLATVNPYVDNLVGRADQNLDPIFHIFPNPAIDCIEIKTKFKTGQNHHIEIFNSIGKKVKDIWTSEMNIKLDISNFPEGMYLIQVSNRDKKTVKKLIIDAK